MSEIPSKLLLNLQERHHTRSLVKISEHDVSFRGSLNECAVLGETPLLVFHTREFIQKKKRGKSIPFLKIRYTIKSKT